MQKLVSYILEVFNTALKDFQILEVNLENRERWLSISCV